MCFLDMFVYVLWTFDFENCSLQPHVIVVHRTCSLDIQFDSDTSTYFKDELKIGNQNDIEFSAGWGVLLEN